MSDIIIHEVQPEEQQYTKVLLSLFVKCFPEYTRYTSQIKESMELGRDLNPKILPHHWLIEYNKKFVGFTLFNYVINGNFGFGRYIGVDPAFGRNGIGYEIIKNIVRQIDDDSKRFEQPFPLGFCAEVESPEQATNPDEINLRRMRLSYFINKCKAIELDVDYLEPQMISGQMQVIKTRKLAVPMRLLLFTDNPITSLSVEEMALMVERIYLDHYMLEPNSELIRNVLDSIGQTTQMYV